MNRVFAGVVSVILLIAAWGYLSQASLPLKRVQKVEFELGLTHQDDTFTPQTLDIHEFDFNKIIQPYHSYQFEFSSQLAGIISQTIISDDIEGVDASYHHPILKIDTDHLAFDQALVVIEIVTASRHIIIEVNLVRQEQSNKTQSTGNRASAAAISEFDQVESILSGNIYFDRLLFDQTIEDDTVQYALLPNQPQTNPSRFVKVNLHNEDDQIIATTYTNERGQYQFIMNRYNNQQLYTIEVVAQLSIDYGQAQPIQVVVFNQSSTKHNANSQGIYHVISDPFTLDSGENYQDLRLTTGWQSTLGLFDTDLSFAQPFAILDSLTKGFVFLRDNLIPVPNNLETLKIYWSQDPQEVKKNTGYFQAANNLIYISGSNAQDIDKKISTTISEWNEHTILHEFGHYYLKKIIGRDDTQGGQHHGFGFSSLPLAFSEGLATSIARTVLQDWQDKRVPYQIEARRTVNSTVAITHNLHQQKLEKVVNSNGYIYARPVYNFSPFIEETISFFISSLIDHHSHDSEYTAKLASEFGMLTLHQALTMAAQQPELLTIYSVANQLKLLQPDLDYKIDLLGEPLHMVFVDGWGTYQYELTSHVIDGSGQLLDPASQYPFYLDISDSLILAVDFNGGLQSTTAKRSGTIRYLKFLAPHNGNILLTVNDITDSKEHLHRFTINVLHQGTLLSRSSQAKHHPVSFIRFAVTQDQTYIIRISDSSYLETDFRSDQTITTEVELGYR